MRGQACSQSRILGLQLPHCTLRKDDQQTVSKFRLERHRSEEGLPANGVGEEGGLHPVRFNVGRIKLTESLCFPCESAGGPCLQQEIKLAPAIPKKVLFPCQALADFFPFIRKNILPNPGQTLELLFFSICRFFLRRRLGIFFLVLLTRARVRTCFNPV
mgnify:CR=1 FL=1